MLKTLTLFSVIVVGLILLRFLTLPHPVQQMLISKYGRPMYSTSDYAGTPLEPALIHKVKVYQGFFTFDRLLGPNETKKLVKFLLDPTIYDSAQENRNLDLKELVFVYYDSAGILLGESHLNPHGEILTFPPELIGRNGYLTGAGLNQIRSAIE